MPHTVFSYVDEGHAGAARGYTPIERVVYAGDDLSITIRLKAISSVIPAPHNSDVTFKLMEEQFGQPLLIKTWKGGITPVAGIPGFVRVLMTGRETEVLQTGKHHFLVRQRMVDGDNMTALLGSFLVDRAPTRSITPR